MASGEGSARVYLRQPTMANGVGSARVYLMPPTMASGAGSARVHLRPPTITVSDHEILEIDFSYYHKFIC